MSGLVFAVSTKSSFDARVFRPPGGAPFTVFPDGTASNEMLVSLVNRTKEDQVYSIVAKNPDEITLEIVDEDLLSIEAGEKERVPIHISFKPSLTRGKGRIVTSLIIEDQKRECSRKGNHYPGTPIMSVVASAESVEHLEKTCQAILDRLGRFFCLSSKAPSWGR